MAYSYRTYPGTGAQTDFAVDFPYLDADHVGVTVDGVSTAFTWVNSQTVRISPAPGNGTSVKISRDSSRASRIANFADSQALTAASLNEDIKQAFYVAQEAFDAVAEAPSGGDMRAVNNLSEVNPSAARSNIGALASSNPAITGNLTLDAAPSSALHAVSKAWVEAQIAAIPSGSGEVNTMASVGAGASLYKEKSGVQFKLRTLVQGTGVVITEGTDTIQIDATGVGGGEVNVGANVNATGEALYVGKSGVALQFKGVGVGLGVKKTATANDVTLAIDEAASIAWTAAHSYVRSIAHGAPTLKLHSNNNGALTSGGILSTIGYGAIIDLQKTSDYEVYGPSGMDGGGVFLTYGQHKVSGNNPYTGPGIAVLHGVHRAQLQMNSASGSHNTDGVAFYAGVENLGARPQVAYGHYADVYHSNTNSLSASYGYVVEVFRSASQGRADGYIAKVMETGGLDGSTGFLIRRDGGTQKWDTAFGVGASGVAGAADIGFDTAYGTIGTAAFRMASGQRFRLSGLSNAADLRHTTASSVFGSSDSALEFVTGGSTVAFAARTDGVVAFRNTTYTIVGGAGGAAALPATPVAYLPVFIKNPSGGAPLAVKIPCFNF